VIRITGTNVDRWVIPRLFHAPPQPELFAFPRITIYGCQNAEIPHRAPHDREDFYFDEAFSCVWHEFLSPK
jgi:hypothetical protein